MNCEVRYFQFNFNIKRHCEIKYMKLEKSITKSSHIFRISQRLFRDQSKSWCFAVLKFLFILQYFFPKKLVPKGWNLVKHNFYDAFYLIADCTWIYRAMGGLCQPHRYSEDLWLAAFR
jgi:hypothetical protein